MTESSAFERVSDRLNQVRRLGLERHLRHHEAVRGVEVKLGDRWLVNFSSNDYLGLAQHPDLKAAAIAAVSQQGTGSGASRLVTGSSHLHQQLETAIARWKGTEAAIAFNSGYQANQGVLVGLAKGEIASFSTRSLMPACEMESSSAVRKRWSFPTTT